MIGFVSRFVVLVAVWVFTLAAGAAPRAEHVFIISIDGGKPEAMKRSNMPVLKKLVEEGACTWTAQTIHPSVTLPAHTSMLTGVRMDKHQITWNDWKPNKGVVRVPTVFTATKEAGFTTAMFVGKEKFRHLLQPGTVDEFWFNGTASQLVAKGPGAGTDMKEEEDVFAHAVAANAAEYIVKSKPGLCFIHFTDPDAVGHEHGWGSPEQIKAFANVDAALGVVLKSIRQASIAESSVIIISADHGGHGKGHSQGTPEDMQIPWIAWGKGVKKHFEITVPVNTCDTAATVFWLLDVQPSSALDGVVVRSAFE
jgi:predicted AlkP superfamily pyrophosphatase or phosphodiesterase